MSNIGAIRVYPSAYIPNFSDEGLQKILIGLINNAAIEALGDSERKIYVGIEIIPQLLSYRDNCNWGSYPTEIVPLFTEMKHVPKGSNLDRLQVNPFCILNAFSTNLTVHIESEGKALSHSFEGENLVQVLEQDPEYLINVPYTNAIYFNPLPDFRFIGTPVSYVDYALLKLTIANYRVTIPNLEVEIKLSSYDLADSITLRSSGFKI